MRRGVVGALFLVGLVVLLGEVFYVRNFMLKTSVLKETGRENEFIEAMDEMEIFKRFLNKIVQFSYCESNNDISIMKDRMAKYANFYGITVDFQKLEIGENSINLAMKIEKKGSFFVLRDEVKGEFKVSC